MSRFCNTCKVVRHSDLILAASREKKANSTTPASRLQVHAQPRPTLDDAGQAPRVQGVLKGRLWQVHVPDRPRSLVRSLCTASPRAHRR